MKRLMMAIVSLLPCLALAGCGNGLVPQNRANSSAADVAQGIHGYRSSELGSDLNPSMTHPFQLSYSLKALAAGHTVHVYTGKPWKGKSVTIYYVPAHNFVNDTSGYYLRSLDGIQTIGTAKIQPDGFWGYHWSVGHERNIPKREMFLMARSDQGEYALTQVQHFAQHRY